MNYFPNRQAKKQVNHKRQLCWSWKQLLFHLFARSPFSFDSIPPWAEFEKLDHSAARAVSSSVNRRPLATSVPTPVTTTFTAITTLFIKIAPSPRSWLFGVISHFIWRATRHRAVFWTFLTFRFLFLHGYHTRKKKLLRSDRRFSPVTPTHLLINWSRDFGVRLS